MTSRQPRQASLLSQVAVTWDGEPAAESIIVCPEHGGETVLHPLGTSPRCGVCGIYAELEEDDHVWET